MDNTCRKCLHTAATNKPYGPCLLCEAEQELDPATACTDWTDREPEPTEDQETPPQTTLYVISHFWRCVEPNLYVYTDEAEADQKYKEIREDPNNSLDPDGDTDSDYEDCITFQGIQITLPEDQSKHPHYVDMMKHNGAKIAALNQVIAEQKEEIAKHNDTEPERNHCVWLPDADVISQKIGREPTQDEIDLVRYRFEKGIDGQVDWQMAFDFAIAEEI